MASYGLDQERYIFGSYDSNDIDFIYQDIKESITDWLENLDKIIHVPFRLSILSILYQNKIISFPILKQVLKATAGNLNNHIYTLERTKLIEIRRILSKNRPITLISITEEGKKRFERYLSSFYTTFEKSDF